MSLLFLDFETRSEADLKAVGSYRYAAHPSTEILCCAFARDDEPASLLVYGLDAFLGQRTIVAHHVEFEKSIMREVLGLDLPIDRFIDTAALAARMSLPRKLEDVARYFGLDTGAKDEGKKAILALSKPRKPTKGDTSKWVTREARPDLYTKLEARCIQDVELTRTIFNRLPPLSDNERRIWQVTIAMNERGLKIDRDAIAPAQAVLEKDAAPLVEEFTRLVGCKVKSPTRVAPALGLPNMKKPTVRKALRQGFIEWETKDDAGEKIAHHTDLTPTKRRALEIYQALSKSSVAKLDAMLDRMGKGDRVRGSFIYCGAERTSRWSANGLQPQNFTRGLGHDTDMAFAALEAGVLEMCFTGLPRTFPEPPLTPTSTVSNMLRGFILGPLIVGDLAQIEARGLNWLAEQADMVELFATGGDPYCAMASKIYGRTITKKHDPDERFMGKQAVLGAGYGLGSSGFQFMLDDIYDRQISEEFAKQVIDAYRSMSPKVVEFWGKLQTGFMHVVQQSRPRVQVTRNIAMGMVSLGGKRYAYIELPSGRKMFYSEPTIVLKTPKWKGAEPRAVVEYWGRDIRRGGAWGRVTTYGGKLAENVTQAFSRDVIAHQMLALHDAGFHLNATVHDELVAEDEATPEKVKRFHDILVTVPEWAPGLPLEAEVFSAMRYRK
jgi:DNA polymerase